MLMAALAVDVGSWYVKAQEIQRAADAAALAGVPFMPDFYDDAVIQARATAAKNGFQHGTNGVNVDVQPVPGNRRRLQVTITDPRVRTYFGVLVRDQISVARSATAEYVLPVPLGSPRNYLGTGGMVKSQGNFAPEYLYASINGYCTSKENGDQRASFYFQDLSSAGSNCSSSWPLNTEYEETNYQYTIELPKTRNYATDVLIYDGSFDKSSGGGLALDQDGGGSSTAMATTFVLYQPDQTPLDDFDNPRVDATPDVDVPDVSCSSSGAGRQGAVTFGPASTDTGFTFLSSGNSTFAGSDKWWQLCRIPASALGGRYILRVTNQGTDGVTDKTQGTNNFGIVATPSSPQRICDARTDATCPKVYANEYLSVRAAATGQTANFFLSEIGPEHKGKKVVINLWDPAEGGKTIKIRKPTGANSWADQTFSWKATNNRPNDVNGTSGNNVDKIDLNNSTMDFNGELITISFTLPTDYNPPATNPWWQIAYTFDSSNVTDRTTWSVSIVGDPVHLVG
jgi:hypothetical protein